MTQAGRALLRRLLAWLALRGFKWATKLDFSDGLTLWTSIIQVVPGGRQALRDYLNGGGRMVTARDFPDLTIEQLFGNAPGEVTSTSYSGPKTPAPAPAAPGGLGLKSPFRK